MKIKAEWSLAHSSGDIEVELYELGHTPETWAELDEGGKFIEIEQYLSDNRDVVVDCDIVCDDYAELPDDKED